MSHKGDRVRLATSLRLRGKVMTLDGPPILMGIVNVTPDSFSDGGEFLDHNRAIEHGIELVEQGADWLDIGGESTRPGAQPVDEAEELRRVMPVVTRLAEQVSVPLSIDTSKASVAREALHAGAAIINDVTGFRDPAMIELASRTGAACIVMHMRGTPADMMEQTHYADVMGELTDYFQERMASMLAAGVDRECIAIDPGIGFAKRRDANLTILRRLGEFSELGRPIVLGASRKRIIGDLTGRGEGARLAGTIASSVLAFLKGAHVLRVHDVGSVADAIRVARAIEEEGADHGHHHG